MGGGVSRLSRAAKRIGFQCASFSKETSEQDAMKNISTSGGISSMSAKEESETAEGTAVSNLTKGVCAICLESLSGGGEDGQAIFTAQCMHSFHFICIASNVRHGSITCPICRAQWTQLPRDLTAPRQFPCPQTDPVLRILDDSIATFRVHRRSSLRSARYDDDDPIEPDPTPTHPRLQLELIPILTGPSLPSHHLSCVSPCGRSTLLHGQSRAYLSVRLAHQQATDIVLVASPNGPHLRLLKQSMALVVFLLRPVDRLAIVTYSSAATRAFSLRRMTAHGKRTALQVIDRLFYLGEADPVEGLKKGIKILEDRSHQNPLCSILHLSDSPTRAYIGRDLQVPIQIHHFHVGFGFGMSSGFVMHEFEEFLSRLLGGVIREAQLKIGEEGGLVRLGELRGGEERRIPVDAQGECGFVCVGYSYIDGGIEECLRTGEVVVGIGEKSEGIEDAVDAGGRDLSVERNSNVGRWDYLDPFMARRWAKHLHGYRA